MQIREAKDTDLNDVLFVEREAFNENDEADLVKDILDDPNAEPLLSLIAVVEGQAVGHVLFSRAYLSGNRDLNVSILAPLAVLPDFQRQGIGGKLVKKGLQILSKAGVDVVFVVGHPDYYPRHGFTPAGVLGFEAPFPIPEKDADAWMVQELRSGIIGTVSGKVVCCDALNNPECWRE